MERQPEYPPEYDQAVCCRICGVDTDNCKCAECDTCGQQGEPKCIEEHNLDPGCMIRTIWDLARHTDAGRTQGTALLIERSIGKTVYKDGPGLTFDATYPHPRERAAEKPPHGADAVRIAPYVEGTTLTFEWTVLVFPFTPYAWDEAVRAEEFACNAAWQQTHGCDACPESSEHPGYKAIDPNCTSCAGNGAIL